ncbi:MAG: cytochrome P450 [Pyrinomonadaceae bacterium]
MTVLRKAPGPKGHFLLGNLPDFGSDMLGFFVNCAREYGDVVSLRLGGYPACLLNNPKYFEYVLITNHRNFIKHSFFWRHVTSLFGESLLTSEGDSWLRRRRLAAPAFHGQRVESYGRVMVDYAERMLSRWRDGEVRDIHQEMMHLTMQIVTKTLFDIEMTGAAADEVGQAFNMATAEVGARFRRPFKIPESIPIPGNLRYRRAVRRLNELVYGIIKERRGDHGDRGDFLSMLLAARDENGSAMSDEQLRDEVITLFLAGHETTALVLTWTWYLLSQHPEKEAKLFAELDSVLGGRAPTVNDIPRLLYTEMIAYESMRLYPPAYAFGRQSLADCEIGGYHIARGTTLFLSPWVIHRDERYFENGEQFEPERWKDDLIKRLPKLAYVPFGGGPRVCIGNSFALMEATLLLATIARSFKLRLVTNKVMIPFPSITLRPLAEMRMQVSAR